MKSLFRFSKDLVKPQELTIGIDINYIVWRWDWVVNIPHGWVKNGFLRSPFIFHLYKTTFCNINFFKLCHIGLGFSMPTGYFAPEIFTPLLKKIATWCPFFLWFIRGSLPEYNMQWRTKKKSFDVQISNYWSSNLLWTQLRQYVTKKTQRILCEFLVKLKLLCLAYGANFLHFISLTILSTSSAMCLGFGPSSKENILWHQDSFQNQY